MAAAVEKLALEFASDFDIGFSDLFPWRPLDYARTCLA
jgi:hypothetical protein